MTHKILILALCNTFFFMTEEIEAGVKMKPKTRRQKMVYKVHLPHMRRKTAQVKNSLHLMNKESFQNINFRKGNDFSSHYQQ